MPRLKTLGTAGLVLLLLNELRGLIVVFALIQSGVAGDIIKAAFAAAREQSEHSSPRQVPGASSRGEHD